MKDNNILLTDKEQPNEEHIEKLIRLGGQREEIDPACRARVHQHVYKVWAQQHEKKSLDKTSTLFNHYFLKYLLPNKITWFQSCALAAGMFVLCLAVFIYNRDLPQMLVASVIKMQGKVHIGNLLLKDGDSIYSGQDIDTANSTMVLKWHDGATLKFDQHTKIHFINENEIKLLTGALYFDSKDSNSIRIHTFYGVVSDIGTQFETRLQPKKLLVRVREGEVKVEKQGDQPVYVRSGKVLQLSDEHKAISDIANNGDWLWVDAMDEDFNFNGRTMAEVLFWVATRENLELHFTSELDKQQAEADILHGKFNTTNSRELLKQLSLISDMQYQITNNILMVNYL